MPSAPVSGENLALGQFSSRPVDEWGTGKRAVQLRDVDGNTAVVAWTSFLRFVLGRTDGESARSPDLYSSFCSSARLAMKRPRTGTVGKRFVSTD